MPDDEMQEYNQVSPYAVGFQRWLIEFTTELGKEGPDVVDLTIIIMNCMAKMRGVLYPHELSAAMHNALHFLEANLPDAGAVLAEHWRELEGGYELYQQANSEAAPDDISELLNELPNDFDLRD